MSDSKQMEELLKDAINLSRYCRTGAIPEDHALFEAVEKVEALSSRSWSSPEVTALQKAMTGAMRLIGPNTAIPVLRGWTPFKRRKEKSDSDAGPMVVRYLMILFAVVLMLVTVFYTVWHQRATNLLNEIAATERAQQDLILTDLVIRYQTDEVSQSGTVRTKPVSGLSALALADKITAVRVIESQFWANKGELNDLIGSNYPLKKQLREYGIHPKQQTADNNSGVWTAIDGTISQLVNASVVVFSGGNRSEHCNGIARPRYADRGWMSATRVASADGGATPFFASTSSETADHDGRVSSRLFREDVRLYDALIENFRCVVIGASSTNSASMGDYYTGITGFTHQVELIGIALLPALYGMLGCVLFFMRQYLNDMIPNPYLSRVALRLCVSSLIGILVGWLWNPTQVFAGTEIAIAPLGKLVAAFLAGFSIEVFFNLLDRLVVVGNLAVAKIGTTT
jgi:hypothetical protein